MIISDINVLWSTIATHKQEGKKIVRTNGCFDIMHPWHIETFAYAKQLWDIVIVWLNSDASPYRKTKPGRPINDQKHRSIMLDSIKYIDYVYIFDQENPLDPIATILPDVLLKWGDYAVESIVWYKQVTENGGKVITVPIVEWYSTTNIVEKIKLTI